MGILDKIMFWKKPEYGEGFDDIGMDDLDKEFGAQDTAQGTQQNQDFSQTGLTPTGLEPQPQQSFSQDMQQEQDFGLDQSAEPMQPQMQQRQFGMPSSEQQQGFAQPAQNQQQYSQQYQQYPQHADAYSREIQVLSSKLDALKSSIDLINHRLENMERVIRDDIERRKRSW